MNAKIILIVGLLAMTALAGCSTSSPASENQEKSAYPLGCASAAGYSNQTGQACSEMQELRTEISGLNYQVEELQAQLAVVQYEVCIESDIGLITRSGAPCTSTTTTTTTTTATDWYCDPEGDWINDFRANGYSCTTEPLAADEYGPSFYMKDGDKVLVWAVDGVGNPVPFWVCEKWDTHYDSIPSSCTLVRDAQMDLFAGLEPHEWWGSETGTTRTFKAYQDDTHFITTTNVCDDPYGCKG